MRIMLWRVISMYISRLWQKQCVTFDCRGQVFMQITVTVMWCCYMSFDIVILSYDVVIWCSTIDINKFHVINRLISKKRNMTTFTQLSVVQTSKDGFGSGRPHNPLQMHKTLIYTSVIPKYANEIINLIVQVYHISLPFLDGPFQTPTC